jgi:REP element-mobilizing transposase RayT
MEIMPDHVHLLIEVDPQFGIHLAVKRFKAVRNPTDESGGLKKP